MKAGIIFSGSGPILVLTTHSSFEDRKFIEKLVAKGIRKFIAYEVPVDQVKEKYGHHFDVVMTDVKQTDDLRVMDFDGHRVFYNFSLHELGSSYLHEEAA
ncbi:MAG: hypothetical protein P8075_15785 [Deltaproteobacteria bacterium]|jgi:hypothetical protein